MSSAPLRNVFFKIAIGGKPLPYNGGVIEFKLFDEAVPKTARNFRLLCTGEKTVNGINLHYKNTFFHRVIPQFMVQGGDIMNASPANAINRGQGSISIYGSKFPDEQSKVSMTHNRKGLLSMANSGPNTNGSQFFITTAVANWLDGKHVIFGEIVAGMENLDVMESVRTDGRDNPAFPIEIIECGEIAL